MRGSGTWIRTQKTVLADDVGMGLSLAALDTTYGIDGMWDCYGLWLEGLLQLAQSGRHCDTDR
jgi:hypothetical protein